MDFSKDINRDTAKAYRVKHEDKAKKIKPAEERITNVNYDFANRDNQSEVKKADTMLGRVVSEEEKIAQPEPAVKIDRKKRKFGFDSGFDDINKQPNDDELTK